MISILKADFYRLLKSKSFYICMLVSAGLICFGFYALYWTYKSTGIMDTSFYPDGLSFGILSFTEGSVQLIIGIFLSIFVTSEFTHGTMKNVVSKGFSKVNIYLSKFITMIVAAFIIVLLTFIAGTVCASITIGKIGSLSGEFGSQLFKTIGIELYLYIALTALLLMVAMSVKNLGGAIAINVIGVFTFERILFSLLELAVDSRIKFSQYSLIYNISFYGGMNGTADDYIRSLIVGLVFMLVSTALGIFIFKKSDVK